MKNEFKDENKPREMSVVRKIINVPVGFTLGSAVLGVSLIRAASRMATKGSLSLMGAGATILASGLHLLNFAKFQTIKGWQKITSGQINPKLNVNSTAKLVTNTVNFTTKNFNAAKNAVPDILSGEVDKKAITFGSALRAFGVKDTKDALVKSMQTMLSISPKKQIQDKIRSK